MKIKICGLKSIEDCLTACEAGADYLGFNFYPPSVRYIKPENCRSIINHVKDVYPQVICTGVFVNHTYAQIIKTMDFCRLDLAQLSGYEPLRLLQELGASAFKTIRPTTISDAEKLIGALPTRKDPPHFLVDTYSQTFYGGSGETGNWDIAANIARKHAIFLAGGLNLTNVRSAIEQVNPWGLDVASGVEKTHGSKDPSLIRSFIKTAREFRRVKLGE